MAWMIVPAKWALGIAPCRQARLFKRTSVFIRFVHESFPTNFLCCFLMGFKMSLFEKQIFWGNRLPVFKLPNLGKNGISDILS